MQLKHFYFGFILLTFFYSCTSTNFLLETKSVLQGMVYDTENKPISGYELILNDTKKTYTDINGRFSFLQLKPGVYSIKGKGANYISIEQSYNFTDKTGILYISVPSLDHVYIQVDNNIEKNNIENAKKLLECLPNEEIQSLTYKLYSNIISYKESTSLNEKEALLITLQNITQLLRNNNQ